MNKERYKLNLLGKGITKIFSKDENRMNNLEVAAFKINNYVVAPGEIFSFNKVLGERTLKNGYKLAESIDNGKIVKTVGGGICQVSTTLNIALNNVGVEIIERHHHSAPVNYANKKEEAAVAYGTLDYRFKNTTDKSLIIKANIDQNNMKVVVEIYEEM